MTNLDAIRAMDQEQFAGFLDDVYVAGLNGGLYAARLKEGPEKEVVLMNNPFDLDWLMSAAETEILHNVGLADASEEDEEAASSGKGFHIKIGASVEIRTGGADSNDEELEELEEKLEELLEELEELEEEEPEDEDSDEYEEWEEAVEELKTEIEELEEEIEELKI